MYNGDFIPIQNVNTQEKNIDQRIQGRQLLRDNGRVVEVYGTEGDWVYDRQRQRHIEVSGHVGTAVAVFLVRMGSLSLAQALTVAAVGTTFLPVFLLGWSGFGLWNLVLFLKTPKESRPHWVWSVGIFCLALVWNAAAYSPQLRNFSGNTERIAPALHK